MTKITVRLKPHCSHRLPVPDGGLGKKYGPGTILKVTPEEAVSFADKFESLPEEMIRPEAVQSEYVEPIATPAAFRLAKQHDVDLTERADEIEGWQGSGVGGKITKADVQEAIDEAEAESGSS